MPNFPDCKGFSENAAHVCACLLCANGKASLGGMLQAAFLKANRNSAMWESPTLSQANEKPKIRIRCKREVPANCFSLHMEQEGLEAELRIPPNGHQGAFTILHAQGASFSLPCSNFSSAISCTHTHLQLNLLTRSWIFSTISAQTALTPRSSCFGVQTQPRACGCMEPCCWHWMLQCMARAFYAVALYACKWNIIAQILQIFLPGSISGTSIVCVSPPGGSPWALPLGISPVWFPAEQPELGWCYVLWSAICWNFVLLLFQWRMVLLAQEMDKGCPDWHLTCELSAQCKQLEGGVWTAEIICVP